MTVNGGAGLHFLADLSFEPKSGPPPSHEQLCPECHCPYWTSLPHPPLFQPSTHSCRRSTQRDPLGGLSWSLITFSSPLFLLSFLHALGLRGNIPLLSSSSYFPERDVESRGTRRTEKNVRAATSGSSSQCLNISRAAREDPLSDGYGFES